LAGGEVKLDEKDMRLLELLRRDARTPYSRLSEELGLSESAVRKRMARLKRLGVIKRFTIDYLVPGEVLAIIMVKVQPPTPTPKVAEEILRYRSVERVYEVTGEYDIIVMARARSPVEMNNLIEFIRSVEGVVATYTMVVLRAY
jgi:Lrp/AsnC family transcriptional regulator of lysine biosynthesis